MIDLLTGLTIGLHIASAHIPAYDGAHNFNPGIYARAENGITGGVYANSLGRTSAYLGYTAEAGAFALTVGGVTGYRSVTTCHKAEPLAHPICKTIGAGGAVTLMFAPSVALPSVFGVTPRLSVIPRIGATHSTVLHLSVEHTF